MKFTIEKNNILNALNNVTKALSQKVTIPVLNGIKFDLNNKGLTLIGSDSELTIKVEIPEKEIKNIENTGTAIIQSKNILDIIRKMPSDVINFETSENHIRIYSDINEFKLNCYELKDYPDFQMEDSKNNFSIKANEFKSLVELTSYAISTQEKNPIFTGMNIRINNNILECVTTDSYRLAKKTLILEENVKEEVNIIIPGRSILELYKIIEESDNKLYIHLFNNKVMFVYENIHVQSNLISGTYPDTTNFIPNDFAYMINLDLKHFYDAIDRSTLLSSNKDKNVIKLSITKKEMLIYSSVSELGKTEEKIEIDSNKIDKIDISINSKYLLDALKVIKDDSILLLLNSDDKPIILKSVTDDSYLELILLVKNF